MGERVWSSTLSGSTWRTVRWRHKPPDEWIPCCPLPSVVASLDGMNMAQLDQQDQTEIHLPRQSHSPLRVLRANVYDLVVLLRDAVYAIFGFVIIVTLGALYFNAATDRKGAESVYESLKLLTFQSSIRLPPNDPLGDL